MRIMQSKVSNKLGIQANSLKPEKRPSTKKISIQNHEIKFLGTELKPKKMKKTRSTTASELEEGSFKSLPKGHDKPLPPQKPPPLVSPPSPAKTPSPKKPTLLKSYASPTPSKAFYASPNYMKSTSSSDARKEQRKESISSSSTLQRVSKSLNRTSSLKKVRTLTKAPSFKHTRLGGNKCSKVVFCENHDVQRATCSSTLKDSKFPPYLMLNPGATEAEGTSAMNVCPYNYCSLNGHHHNPAPPLKCFISSRRRHLKAQRVVRPEDLSPQKATFLQKEVEGVDYEDEVICSDMPVTPEVDQRDDFFVKIYVPGVEVDVAHGGDPCTTVDSKRGLDQSEGNISLNVPQTPQLIKVEDSASVSLDEFFGESSDMEWKEGQFCTAHLEHQSDISEHGADRNDQKEPDLKSDGAVSGNLEGFMADKQLLPYAHEEIVEWLYLSDVSSMPDSESSQPGVNQIEKPSRINKGDGTNTSIEDDATISNEELEVNSTNEQGSVFSDDPTEEFDCYMYSDEENHGDEVNTENETVKDIGENSQEGLVMESTENFLQETKNVKGLSSMEQSLQAVNNCHAQFDGKEANNTGEEEDYPTTYVLHSHDDCVSDIKSPGMEDINEATEVEGFLVVGNKTSTRQIKKESYCRKRTDPREELLSNCLKLKKSMRQEKEDEEKEGKEFNPRAPNFLPIEPDPEAERVDLRHQEMDERRNSEEWMLDYALQRTVNQLAPARKRKVSLLVEAFECVLPIPKCEPHLRRISSGFAHSRPIQACS